MFVLLLLLAMHTVLPKFDQNWIDLENYVGEIFL